MLRLRRSLSLFLCLLLAAVLWTPPAAAQANVNKRTLTVTIASGASLSSVALIGDATVIAVLMPAAWTAATLTFQGSNDNSTFYNLVESDGTEVEATVAVDQAILLEPKHFAGFKYLKVRSGTSTTAVNQAAARTLTLLVRII